jgi:hypothetical protein
MHAPVPKLAGDFAHFQSLLDKLMAKNPADRFQNETELFQALESLGAAA